MIVLIIILLVIVYVAIAVKPALTYFVRYEAAMRLRRSSRRQLDEYDYNMILSEARFSAFIWPFMLPIQMVQAHRGRTGMTDAEWKQYLVERHLADKRSNTKMEKLIRQNAIGPTARSSN